MSDVVERPKLEKNTCPYRIIYVMFMPDNYTDIIGRKGNIYIVSKEFKPYFLAHLADQPDPIEVITEAGFTRQIRRQALALAAGLCD